MKKSSESSVWKRVRQKATGLTRAEPGQRFQQQHARRSGKRKSKLIDGVYIILAVVLILAGALLALVPGLPGIFLSVPGLALLAFRFRHFAMFLDKAELIGRRIIRRIIKFVKRS
jgi:hypothetical protein